MSRTSDLDSLYKNAPAILWVEDEVTRAYLSAVWPATPYVRILVAGGGEAVAHLVNDARAAGLLHVSGLRDRDFGQSNEQTWRYSTTVFVPPVLEIENYLLEPASIEACAWNTSGITAGAIDAALLERVKQQSWWMAGRASLAALKATLREKYVEDPREAEVTDLESACRHIFDHEWWREHKRSIGALDENAMRQRIEEAHRTFAKHIESGRWRHEFSGKELLHRALERTWTQKREGEGILLKAEFAKAIGQAQARLDRVPAELVEVRRIILSPPA